jgi:ABC-type transport system involved in cytochrome bd biosynthesis fused ATPase/permease subunit
MSNLGYSSISVAGPVALCTQNPSILPLTIRENIILGHSQMNSQRYYKAISCAQLQKDLEQFPENELSKVFFKFILREVQKKIFF